MGIGSWLTSLSNNGSPTQHQQTPEPRPEGTGESTSTGPLLTDGTGAAQVVGTTTFAQDTVRALADDHRLEQRDVLETRAVLRRYPEFNNAVAVLVDDVPVGALSQAHSQALTMGLGDEHIVDYQLHVLHADEQFSAVAYVWLGSGAPQWEFTRDTPAPLTTPERAAHAQQEATRNVDEALADAQRAPQVAAGMAQGYHYTELVEPIRQLKREGRLQEALTLCYEAIAAAELEARSAGREPAPAYTLEAAIVHRKLNQLDEERAVLERWMKAAPQNRRAGSKVAERMAKLAG